MAVPKEIISDSQNPIFVGDSWEGFTIIYQEDGEARDLTGATIRMTLVSDTGGSIVLSSATGGFTINNPLTGGFVCNPINRMAYPAGTYLGDLEITFADTTRYTPILVQLYLKDDVTK
jgi:hypothetical protein